MSRSTWARGLKLIFPKFITEIIVALHVGAWIETLMVNAVVDLPLSRSTWARGLKHGSKTPSTESWRVSIAPLWN